MRLPVGLDLKFKDLTSRGLYQEAMEILREPLANHPHNIELLSMAGRCALELGHGEYALQCLEFARTRSPRNLELAEQLGCTYRRLGRFDEAVELFDGLSAHRPDQPHLVGQRGLTYLARGDRNLAEPDLRRCLVKMFEGADDVNPETVEVARQVREGLLQLGLDFPVPDPEALKLLPLLDSGDFKELAVRCTGGLTHQRPWLYYLRGRAKLGLGAHREATLDLTHALELEPNLIPAYRYRGHAWSRIDRARAAADYHKYLELGDSRAPDVLGGLGLMYFELRRIDEAISPLETCIDLSKDSPDGTHWEALARCYLGIARHQDALRAFNQALSKSQGTSAEARYLRGTVLEQLGARDHAIKDYKAYLEENPRGPAAVRARDRLAELGATTRKGFLSQLFGKDSK